VLYKHIVLLIDKRELSADKHSMNPESLYRHIGALIRERRKKVDPPLTQDKLAKRVGMSRAALANIETGRQNVFVHQLYAFAEALELMPEAFLLPMKRDPLTPETSELEFSDDLKPRQKEQIARLLFGATNEPQRKKGGSQ
jgi:transcriptional regulator with XRE-family HTH domain